METVAWIARIVFVTAMLAVAASILRVGRMHPALEAIQRTRNPDWKRPEASLARKIIALVLIIFAAIAAIAGTIDRQLQTALDRRGFSCGVIDGAWGRKSERALEMYFKAMGIARLPSSTEVERHAVLSLLYSRAPCVPGLLKIETIGEDAMRYVTGPIPEKPEEKAAMAYLGYATLLEYYAEKGHCSEALIKRLNPKVEWPNPAVGTSILVPDVREDTPLALHERAKKIGLKAAKISVSISRLEVVAYDAAGRIIFFAPCSIAAEKKHLPQKGALKVTTMAANPNYTWTPDDPQSTVGRKILQPGPNNPVGLAWIGLSLPGYGIHGTPYPERIGRAESHGCFRLSNWCAVRFYNLVDTGTEVLVEE